MITQSSFPLIFLGKSNYIFGLMEVEITGNMHLGLVNRANSTIQNHKAER